MVSEHEERLQNELELLEAMYPSQVTWHEKRRELTYTSDSHHGSFTLRLSDDYLLSSLPDVLSATIAKKDVRQALKQKVRGQETGEEVLDSIITDFNALEGDIEANDAAEHSNVPSQSVDTESKATAIVWLHHLLNTNKRKLALSPRAPGVSGMTKPGYPGVLIYSGPKKGVYEHVNELKHQNWQAFQIRLETDDEWSFKHGHGVKEVESMGEIVTEIGVEHKGLFMEAMRMK